MKAAPFDAVKSLMLVASLFTAMNVLLVAQSRRAGDVTPSARDIRAKARAVVTLTHNGRTFDVAMYAADETTAIIDADYCRASAGMKNFSGTYQLVTMMADKIVARTTLGEHFEFIDENPFEGVSMLTIPKPGGALLVVSQYSSCNGVDCYFYSIDDAGAFHPVPVIGQNSHEVVGDVKAPEVVRASVFVSPGPSGLLQLEGDRVLASHYNNRIGNGISEWFAYDGKNLRLARSCVIGTPECDDPKPPH